MLNTSASRPGTSEPVRANGPIREAQVIAVGTRVPIPQAMRVVRARPPREVTLTGSDVPLIHPKDPDHKQIQEALVARSRVFDLSDATQAEAAEQVWQAIAAKRAFYSEHKTHFDETRGKFFQYIRWSEVVHALPGHVDEAIAAARATHTG